MLTIGGGGRNVRGSKYASDGLIDIFNNDDLGSEVIATCEGLSCPPCAYNSLILFGGISVEGCGCPKTIEVFGGLTPETLICDPCVTTCGIGTGDGGITTLFF